AVPPAWLLSLARVLPPPASTPFPYTTLFRSPALQIEGGRHPVLRVGGGDALVGRRDLLVGARVVLVVEGGAPRLEGDAGCFALRSEEHTSELQSREKRVCRLLLEKKNRQSG